MKKFLAVPCAIVMILGWGVVSPAIAENGGEEGGGGHHKPKCVDTEVVWGIQRGLGVPYIYRIDLSTTTASFVADTGKNVDDRNYPNGAAYDLAAERAYYAERDGSSSDLFFFDFEGNQTFAGDLVGLVAGAAIHDGRYYYIPQQTRDLYAATLLPDGTMGPNVLVKSDVGGEGAGYDFGDMVIPEDGSRLYISVSDGFGGPHEFFSVDLSGNDYNLISTGGSVMQLAFGLGGVLYGHNAANGMFYDVDLATGERTEIGTVSGSETGVFTDLASFAECEPKHYKPHKPKCVDTEVVWGIQRGLEVPYIYRIDLATTTASFVADTGKNVDDRNYPNGAAYDLAAERAYYAERDGSSSDLFFFDFEGNQTFAGDLVGLVAGAAIHDGQYYYIPQQTRDLYAATLLPDGTMGPNVLVKSDVGGPGAGYDFGDMAIPEDGAHRLYISVSDGFGGEHEFFSVDLTGNDYNLISTGGSVMQLAFGLGGGLYGHNAANGMFYDVDLATGARTEIGTVSGSETGVFTDLASFAVCEPKHDW